MSTKQTVHLRVDKDLLILHIKVKIAEADESEHKVSARFGNFEDPS